MIVGHSITQLLKSTALAGGLLIVSLTMASAATTKVSPTANPHIHYVRFNADGVTQIPCEMGVSTLIQTAADEVIETISSGDSKSWSIIPKKGSGLFFVKPLEENTSTNVNVVTNKRVYSLFLFVGKTGTNKAAFQVRFRYPEEEALKAKAAKAAESASMPNLKSINPETVNRRYVYKGSDLIRPKVVFDDGKKTFLRFEGDVPAIFSVGNDRKEMSLNYRREGDYIIVDRVTAQFTLRMGDEVVCLYNQNTRTEREPDEIEAVYGPRKADDSLIGALFGSAKE